MYGESFLELFDLLLEAQELQVMGRLLKINQGMSTNFEELFGYIHNIDSYINNSQKTKMNFVVSAMTKNCYQRFFCNSFPCGKIK